MDFNALLNPLNISAGLAVLMPLLARAKSVTIVTSKNVQLWIAGIAVAVICIPAYFNGLLVMSNLENLGVQVVAMVAINVFLYEYVIKNLVRLFNWLKGQWNK